MDQATQYVQQNSGMFSTIFFIVFALVILYVVYTYLYPADDPTYVQFLNKEVDARHQPVSLKHNGLAPSIFTGGEFTLSFWLYIDDWNYKVASYKPLFNLGPPVTHVNTQSVLTGMLTPYQNGLMVRAAAVASSSRPAPGATPTTSDATPDITLASVRSSLLQQQTGVNMFQSTVDTPCDIKDVPLQRWVCTTIVSSGRVLDVYMDGKLARSCVLENVVKVPRGKIFLTLGDFGGRFSSVQMWNQQLTPDVIYGIYMMGPTQTQHDLFTGIAKYLNLNVSFTGSAPGQPIPSAAAVNPFNQMAGQASSVYNVGAADASSAYNTAASDLSSLYASL